MPIVPSGNVTKHIAFDAPYTSNTFKAQMKALYNGNRVLSGLVVTSDGVSATVADGAFIQRGIIVELTSIPTATIPGTFPQFLIADNVDQISASDVNVGFVDQTAFNADPDLVLLAKFTDPVTFRPVPNGSIDAILNILSQLPRGTNYIGNGGVELDNKGTNAVPVVATAGGPGVMGPDLWQAVVEDGTSGTMTLSMTTTVGEFFSGSGAGKAVFSIGDSTIANVSQEILPSEFSDQMRGKPITFSVWVRTSTAGAVRAFMKDDIQTVESPLHTGGGSFEKLTLTATLDSLASNIRFGVRTDAASTFFFDEAVVVVGNFPVGVTFFPETDQETRRRAMLRYESGTQRVTGIGVHDGTDYVISGHVRFRERKSSVPSISTSNIVVREENSAADVSGSYGAVTVSNITDEGFSVSAKRPASGGVARPRELSFDWTAESVI